MLADPAWWGWTLCLADIISSAATRLIDHTRSIARWSDKLPPGCWVITLYESQPGPSVYWIEYLIFYSSVRTAHFKVTQMRLFGLQCVTFFLCHADWYNVIPLYCQKMLILHTFLKGVRLAGVSVVYLARFEHRNNTHWEDRCCKVPCLVLEGVLLRPTITSRCSVTDEELDTKYLLVMGYASRNCDYFPAARLT